MSFLFVESSSPHSNISVVQNAVKALKLLFFSAGLISTLLMVKGALIPFFYENFFPNLIASWNLFRYFLSSPLYICIIINSFVLLIAVTSTFHHHHDDHDHDHSHSHDSPPPPPLLSTTDDHIHTSTNFFRGNDINIDDSETQTSVVGGSRQDDKGQQVEKTQEESLSRDEEREGEGEDTIDSTWKTIVEGKTKMLTKSESVPPRSSCRIEDQDQHSSTAKPKWKELRKLETFNDGVSIRRLGGLRRDPSVGVDEFNQQVEAFINKFNQDMRLQRQESDQRFLDMVKPGL